MPSASRRARAGAMGASSSKEPWEEDIEERLSRGMLSPEDEVKRVLRFQNNYYKVLKVDPRTCTAAQIKKAYYKIARVIHPDKCRDPRATEAMGVVRARTPRYQHHAAHGVRHVRVAGRGGRAGRGLVLGVGE